MEFAIFILFVIVIISIIYQHIRESKTRTLIEQMHSRIQKLEEQIKVHKTEDNFSRDQADHAISKEEISNKSEAVASKSIPFTKQSSPSAVIPGTIKESSDFSKKFSTLEKIFVENWTGILGSIILLIGIAFFGITAGLIFSPFARFILINIFTGLIYALYLFLRKKKNMDLLSLWIRSTSGAVFLFSCLGAGGIPGLKWIEDPMLALSLLLLGVGVNLILGFISNKQMLATFHVVLSLIAIAMAPQNFITIILAGGIVFFGIILSYREKWDYHLLLTILSFFAYHLFWNDSAGSPEIGENPVEWISGVSINTVIGLAAILIHYRSVYAGRIFQILPFVTHLATWLSMGIGFLLYSSGSKWNPVVLTAASVCVFILSRKSKKLGIVWLFRTDILVAESLILFGIIFLYRWELSSAAINLLALVEIMIFTAMMLYERDKVLSYTGYLLIFISDIIFMFVYLSGLTDENKTYISILLLAAVLLNAIFPVLMKNHNTLDFDSERLLDVKEGSLNITVTGIFASLFSIILFVNFSEFIWSTSAASILFLFILILRRRFLPAFSGLEFIFMSAGIFIASWISLDANIHIDEKSSEINIFRTVLLKLMYGLPLFIISAASLTMGIKKENQVFKKLTAPGIYFFAVHLILLTYFSFNIVSPFLPGVLYLIYSIIFLELSRFIYSRWDEKLCLNGNTDVHLYISGILMFLAFLFRHVLVHLQSEHYIGFIKIRLMIEIFAILTLLLWAVSVQFSKTRNTFLTGSIFRYFWEIILVFVSFTFFMEIRGEYLAAAWMILALILCAVSGKNIKELYRFRLYSVIFQAVSAFHIAFVSGTFVTPSFHFLDQAWLGGLLALILQFVFVFFYLREKEKAADIEFPEGFKFLKGISMLVEKKKNLFINYPLFIAVALFLYWSFSSAVLTLLWTMEILAVFVLSIALREKHFRHISMGALLVIVARLIFFDMDQAEAIFKIFVFMGVGMLLIFMNYLYNKYKDRY